jgi:GGDEF domain-containing protein
VFSRIKTLLKEYKELKFLAYHDALTGLYNRNWLYKNLQFIQENFLHLYFIDLNNLHEINKNGHSSGDIYIVSVVESLKSILLKNAILIRYAGDEFILISKNPIPMKSLDSPAYTFGWSKISKSVLDAIHQADLNMCELKNIKNGDHL